MPVLPLEVLSNIADRLAEKDLTSLALVSRSFSIVARRSLLTTIRVTSIQRLIRLSKCFVRSPEAAKLVRSIVVEEKVEDVADFESFVLFPALYDVMARGIGAATNATTLRLRSVASNLPLQLISSVIPCLRHLIVDCPSDELFRSAESEEFVELLTSFPVLTSSPPAQASISIVNPIARSHLPTVMVALKTCCGIRGISIRVDNVDFGVAQEITLPLRGNTSVTGVLVSGDFSTDPYLTNSTFFKDLPPVIERLPNLLHLTFDAPATRALQSSNTIPSATEMETSFIQHLSRHPALAHIKFPSGTTWCGTQNVFVNNKLWEPSPDCEEQRDWWLKANKGMMFPEAFGRSIIASPTLSSDRSTPESPDSPTPLHAAFDGHNILAQHCQYDDIFILDDQDSDDKVDEDFFGFGSSAPITRTAPFSSKSTSQTQSWPDRGPDDGTVFGHSLLDPRLLNGDDWSLVQLSPKFSHDVPPIGVHN